MLRNKKQYKNWFINTENGHRKNFYYSYLKKHLKSIQAGVADFITVCPRKPVYIKDLNLFCDFMQVCQSRKFNRVYFEVSLFKNDIEEKVIWGKSGITYQEAFRYFKNFIELGEVPDNKSWDIAIDWTFDKSPSYNQIVKLLAIDEPMLEKLKYCVKFNYEYLDDYFYLFDELLCMTLSSDSTWCCIVLELLERNLAVKVQKDIEFDSFYKSIEDMYILKDKNLPINKEWFIEDDNIIDWINTLDTKWKDRGVSIKVIEVYPDKYVLIAHDIQVLKRLVDLTDNLGKNRYILDAYDLY